MLFAHQFENGILGKEHVHSNTFELGAREILAALGQLTDADLESTIAEYGADSTDDRPLLGKIAGDTYVHYAEHVGWIKELLAALTK